jgi:hypothetical protein
MKELDNLVDVSVHDDGHAVLDVGCGNLWHKVKLG